MPDGQYHLSLTYNLTLESRNNISTLNDLIHYYSEFPQQSSFYTSTFLPSKRKIIPIFP